MRGKPYQCEEGEERGGKMQCVSVLPAVSLLGSSSSQSFTGSLVPAGDVISRRPERVWSGGRAIKRPVAYIVARSQVASLLPHSQITQTLNHKFINYCRFVYHIHND